MPGVSHSLMKLFCSEIAWGPVRIVHIADSDASGSAGMKKLAIAEINSRMGRSFFIRFKENEIPYQWACDRFACIPDRFYRPGNRNPVLQEDVMQKSAAVKAGRTCSAPNVRNADIFFPFRNQRLDNVGRRLNSRGFAGKFQCLSDADAIGSESVRLFNRLNGRSVFHRDGI